MMKEISNPNHHLQAHLDAFVGGKIMGWVRDESHPDDAMVLLLYFDGQRISSHRADEFRADLEAAGVGGGRYGVSIDVPPAILGAAYRKGEPLEVRWSRQQDKTLWIIDIGEVLSIPAPLQEVMPDRLDLIRRTRIFGPGLDPLRKASGSPSVLPLFEAVSPIVALAGGRPSLFAYADYIRRVQQLERQFSPDRIDSDLDHFIRWYLDHYAAGRAPRRVPLSHEIIQWLNQPVIIGGAPFDVTRVMLWYLASDDAPASLTWLGDEARYRRLVYWWAVERAPALCAEDCLVSPIHVAFLRQVPHRWSGQPFPLSIFMEEALERHASLTSFGPMHNVSARMTAFFVLFVDAIEEPGLLRFVPQEVLKRFFGGEQPLFDELARKACSGNPAAEPLTTPIYRNLLAHNGFDFDSLKFTSIDRSGHRSEAARLGSVVEQPCVDVQLIGPINRASGIGQAARLSLAILRRTTLDVAATDFIMDNPQPEHQRGETVPAPGVRAHVNIIHLNPDMLPLAYAYKPDVHQGAYTIGFFFWELDKPADCHRLALDLVDEIWVASEYNRLCFAAWTQKPVINVGMALDMGAMPSRESGRAQLAALCDVEPDDFVFFTAYDSLSYVTRKNPLGVLQAFKDAFAGETRVRLIIKTHNAAVVANGFAGKVWDVLSRAAFDDPRVVLINETLPYANVMAMIAGSDCYVSLHRSEGFGFGMLEAMHLNVPVVCTAYSGNLDFCDETTAWLVEADEVGVRDDEYAHVRPDHRWAEPRHQSAVTVLREVRMNAERRSRLLLAASARVETRYSLDAAAGRYAERLDVILRTRSSQRSFMLRSPAPSDISDPSTPVPAAATKENRKRVFWNNRKSV